MRFGHLAPLGSFENPSLKYCDKSVLSNGVTTLLPPSQRITDEQEQGEQTQILSPYRGRGWKLFHKLGPKKGILLGVTAGGILGALIRRLGENQRAQHRSRMQLAETAAAEYRFKQSLCGSSKD